MEYQETIYEPYGNRKLKMKSKISQLPKEKRNVY